MACVVMLCAAGSTMGLTYLVAAAGSSAELMAEEGASIAAGFVVAAGLFAWRAGKLVAPIVRALEALDEPAQFSTLQKGWTASQRFGDRIVALIVQAGVLATAIPLAVALILGRLPADVLGAGLLASALALCSEIILVLPVGRALMVPVLDVLKRRDSSLELEKTGPFVADLRRVIVPGLFLLNAMSVVLVVTLVDRSVTAPMWLRVGTPLVALGLQALVIWLYLRLLLRPLRQLIDGLSTVHHAEHPWRAGVLAIGELGSVGVHIDSMLDRVRESERVNAHHQQLLERSQRMETLGVLAASVAHDVNNPATTLQSNLYMLQQGLADDADPEVRELLEESAEAVARIQHIVSELMSHARQETAAVTERVALQELLTSSVRLGRRELVGVQVDLAPCDELSVAIPRERVRQVFLNLFVNAAHALAGCAEPRLRVGVRRGQGSATVLVSNNGPAIPEQIAAHIFEPFFTTKPAGVGTGLGLHICQQILQDIGGDIRLSSDDEWTTFEVELPVAQI